MDDPFKLAGTPKDPKGFITLGPRDGGTSFGVGIGAFPGELVGMPKPTAQSITAFLRAKTYGNQVKDTYFSELDARQGRVYLRVDILHNPAPGAPKYVLDGLLNLDPWLVSVSATASDLGVLRQVEAMMRDSYFVPR